MASVRRHGFKAWRLGLALALFLAVPLQAQELNCSVSVNYQKLQGSQYDYLRDLEDQIRRYLNERRWTNDTFEDIERIDCMVQVFFEEAITLTRFRARLVLATRRPIYGTTQYTTVLQLSDPNWEFEYPQGTPLIFNMEQFHPLTSVLDFYAFIILGYDYDTFSELGGTPFFEQARRIAELAQAAGASGWNQIGDDRSRVALITQLLDPRYRAVRQAYFKYHFEGLDHFVLDPDAARAAVLDVLRSLEALYQEVSRPYVMDLFFTAKYQELATLFEGSRFAQEAFSILSELDPSHLSEYNRLAQ